MSKGKLKLFIFEGFSLDHTNGLAFAIAENEAEARMLIEENRGFGVTDWGKVSEHPIKKIACVSGGG